MVRYVVHYTQTSDYRACLTLTGAKKGYHLPRVRDRDTYYGKLEQDRVSKKEYTAVMGLIEWSV